MTDNEIITQMLTDQQNGYPFCPRCGQPIRMGTQARQAAASNALSRQVDGLYVCDDCGTDEALRAFVGLPLPLNLWAYANRNK